MNQKSVEAPDSAGLAQRSAVAFSWGVFGSVAKVLLTLLVQAILARLLGPNAFGLFALGVLIMGLAGYFADLGIATSLVQRSQVNNDDIRFVLTLNVLTATVVGSVVVMLSQSLSEIFGKAESATVFRWMAPVFLLNALASVSTSLLRRQLDYRSIQIANLFGYAFGFGVVGIATAWWAGSVQALIAAYLAQSACTLALLYRKTRHTLGLGIGAGDRRTLIGFGVTVLLTNLVNWLMGSLDRLLVGRVFAAATLGHYSASYNLMVAPVGALYPNLQSTVFSSMARMQNDLPRMQRAYVDLLRVVTIAFAGLAFFAGSLVHVVYGAQWGEAARLAIPFCFIAPFMLIWACATPVLWNTGNRSLEWKVQLPMIAVAALAVFLASRWSIAAVAWTMAAIYVARALLMAALACRALGIAWTAAFSAIWPGLWMAAVVASVAGLCEFASHTLGLPALAELSIGLPMIFVTMLLLIILAPKCLPPTVRPMIRKFQQQAPAWIKPLLNRLTGNHDQ